MSKENEIAILRDVFVDYDGAVVLENINLSIKQHDFLGIIGPNGGGKTTLLKVILGLVRPLKGEVKVFGVTPAEASKFIGYVPQFNLFDREFPISVWDVVLMGRLIHTGLFKYYSDEDKRITAEALKAVDMLGSKDKHISKLSEGEKQRIFIARALTTRPRLLLLDEPTASVDTCVQTGVYELLKALKEKMTIVLVSHDIGVISSYVDKIACLNRKLFYHDSKEIDLHDLEAAYQCPIDIIAHGIPHRVMKEHKE